MNRVPQELQVSAPKGTVWFGGPVDKCSVSLRIYCHDGKIEDIGAILGVKASKSWQIGDVMGRSGYRRRFSGWIYDTPTRSDGDLDKLLGDMFVAMSVNDQVWKRLNMKYKIDLFVVLELESTNRGTELASSTLMDIARRGLKIGFDIYYTK